MNEEPPVRRPRAELPAAAALLLLAGLLFAALEARMPFYFLWDDNVSFYLPSYVYNLEAVLGGEIPHVNYHQYLGHTHLAAGQTAVLYPPLYPALVLTGLVWGDQRPAVDVLAVGHLLFSALGMFVLLRHRRVERRASVVAALLWVSFPFLAQVSRNWIFVAYAAAWLPWSFFLLGRLLDAPRRTSSIFTLGAVKALLISQGYVQYAILLVLYESLYLLLHWFQLHRLRCPRRQVFDEARAWVLALLASAALAAPVLLPMLHAKQVSAYRSGGLSFQELTSLSLDAVDFLKAQVFLLTPRAVHETSTAMFYLGLPNLLALGILFRDRRPVFKQVLLVAAAALVLSTAAYGVMYYVPLLSSFRWPFKSFLFVAFFLAVALGRAYQLFFEDERRGVRRAGAVLAALALAGNAGVLLTRDEPFGPNRIEESVAGLREAAAQRYPLAAGRAVSMWLNPGEPEIHRFLAFNHATLARSTGSWSSTMPPSPAPTTSAATIP
jgi:hypothetical protein